MQSQNATSHTKFAPPKREADSNEFAAMYGTTGKHVHLLPWAGHAQDLLRDDDCANGAAGHTCNVRLGQ